LSNESVADPLSASEFPYVDQDTALANQYVTAWTMNQIQLPSGGLIDVKYESDDYAYVQNLRAGQMFKIVGNYDGSGGHLYAYGSDVPISTGSNQNYGILFQLQPGYGKNIADYFSGIDNLYFKSFAHIVQALPNSYEYVSGYVPTSGTTYGTVIIGTDTLGYLQLNPVSLNSTAGTIFNPMALSNIQFGRLYLSQQVWDQSPPIAEGSGFLVGTADALANSGFIKNISDAIKGPNKALWDKGVGQYIVSGKSWIRLNNPNMHKLGGGARVKMIATVDQWKNMTANAETTFDYGQQYNYTLPDGTSSGVASYEPMIGNDENPWRQPIFYDQVNSLIPNDKFFMETPLGETFFPSPSVTYSRITVSNIRRQGVHRHATGNVVHEFYTTKDFPTITMNTGPTQQHDKSDPFSLTSLFYIETRDYMTATEGYYVELNDMNGKEKGQSVYQEDQTTPITSVQYLYKQQPYLNGSFQLVNDAVAIDPQGNVSNANLGTFYDMVADMRQESASQVSVSPMINLDGFVWPFPPFFLNIPMILPNIADDETQFRSGTTTKVVQRFGLLDKVIAQDLGSTVETDNLAYDGETGNVLLTRTTTDYNDTVYSFMYPAHWFYDGMGPAYKNTGLSIGGLSFNGSGQVSLGNASTYYTLGDEVEVITGSSYTYGWVTNVTPTTFTVLQKSGAPMTGSNSIVKVIRSGRRNMANLPIMKVTCMKNPISTFKSNIFSNVLQASADEFTSLSRTFCDCYGNTKANDKPATTNPFVLGLEGNWRKLRSLLYLTSRTQSNYNKNTDIRKDGQFSSFAPYYSYNAGWKLTEQNWTFTQQVTEFSPYGPELEDQDALGRYSSAEFGYLQSLPTGVAANASYNEIGFDGFEDHDFSPCADNHFKFQTDNITSFIDNSQFHTGFNSLRIKANNTVTMDKAIAPCNKNECNVALVVATPRGATTITVTNGMDPVNFQWNVLQGNPQVTYVTADEISVTGNGTPWQVQLIVTDGMGCKVTQVISGK